jgi:hypothetical protein
MPWRGSNTRKTDELTGSFLFMFLLRREYLYTSDQPLAEKVKFFVNKGIPDFQGSMKGSLLSITSVGFVTEAGGGAAYEALKATGSAFSGYHLL